jgi:antitoxin VapB
MARTRAFKSGNSQAVRIPADIAYENGTELEITRSGDVTILYPARGSLKEMVEILRKMPKPPTVELIERTEVPDRERD